SVNEATRVEYPDVARLVFSGIHALLDDQVTPARRLRALTRLKRYTGMIPGTRPFTELAREDVEAHLSRGLLAPSRMEVEKSLATSATLRDGIEKLFKKYEITGADEALAVLAAQFAAYDEFARKTVLPIARGDFALPAAVYALRLERAGVDL